MCDGWHRDGTPPRVHLAPLTLAWLSRHAAAVIFVNLSLGLLGVPALTEMLLVMAGAVAAQGSGSPWAAFAAAVAGSAVGMTISFHIGRAAQPALRRCTAAIAKRTSPRLVMRADDWWRRFGVWSVVLAYFAPGLRHATAMVAGSTNMERKRFVALAVCGACAWSSLLVWGGGILGGHAPAPRRLASADFCVIIDTGHGQGDRARPGALRGPDGPAGRARAGGCVVEDLPGARSDGRR